MWLLIFNIFSSCCSWGNFNNVAQRRWSRTSKPSLESWKWSCSNMATTITTLEFYPKKFLLSFYLLSQKKKTDVIQLNYWSKFKRYVKFLTNDHFFTGDTAAWMMYLRAGPLFPKLWPPNGRNDCWSALAEEEQVCVWKQID